jgi:putative flippase GtrA
MPLQTFRYAACGGGNTLLGLTLYFILVKLIFTHENVDMSFIVFKPHNAALFIASCTTFFCGFLLMKFVVFTSSVLRGRIQFFRYFLSFFSNLIINYFLLKLFVEILHLDAFLSQVITTVVIVTFSYFTQKHFSFRN